MKLCNFYSIQGGGREGRTNGLITEDMHREEERSSDLIVQYSQVIVFPDSPDITGNPSSLLLEALLRTMPDYVREKYNELQEASIGATPGPAVIRRVYDGPDLAELVFRTGIDTRLDAGDFAVDVRPAIMHVLLFPDWPPTDEKHRELLAAVQWQVQYSYAVAHFMDGVETLESLGLGGGPSNYFAGKEEQRHARNADRILSELLRNEDD